jgi:hypothetical protein
MARKLALVALVLAVAHTTVARADEDMGDGADLTGQSSSDGEGTPEVEAVTSPAPAAPEDGDLTVESPVAQPPVGVYDTLAGCESNNNWHIQGRLFSGGLQFDDQTWWAYGGGKYASRAGYASRGQQIEIAQRLHAARGWQPWPACSRRLGLR